MARSFVSWLRIRLVRRRSKSLSRSRGEPMVVESSSSVWRLNKGVCAVRKYMKEVFAFNQGSKFREDSVAARDFSTRACGSTWRNWYGGSRPFFWR